MAAGGARRGGGELHSDMAELDSAAMSTTNVKRKARRNAIAASHLSLWHTADASTSTATASYMYQAYYDHFDSRGEKSCTRGFITNIAMITEDVHVHLQDDGLEIGLCSPPLLHRFRGDDGGAGRPGGGDGGCGSWLEVTAAPGFGDGSA